MGQDSDRSQQGNAPWLYGIGRYRLVHEAGSENAHHFLSEMEALQVYRIIKELDPKAFVSQGNVNTVYGEGFDQNRVKARKRIEAIDKLIAEDTKDEKTQA